MSVERTIHCDAAECERHGRTLARSLPVGFIGVRDEGRTLHFCGWDCVLRFAAAKEPEEIIPALPREDGTT